MFNPTKEVPSLELCRKLKKVGYPQDGGGWYWTQTDTGWRLGYCAEYNLAPKVKIHMMFFAELGRVIFRARHEIIKAPTITEMWEWLPDFITKLIGKDYGMDYELVLGTSAAGLHIMYQYIHWEKEKMSLDRSLIYDNRGKLNTVIPETLLWLAKNRYINFRK